MRGPGGFPNMQTPHNLNYILVLPLDAIGFTIQYFMQAKAPMGLVFFKPVRERLIVTLLPRAPRSIGAQEGFVLMIV